MSMNIYAFCSIRLDISCALFPLYKACLIYSVLPCPDKSTEQSGSSTSALTMNRRAQRGVHRQPPTLMSHVQKWHGLLYYLCLNEWCLLSDLVYTTNSSNDYFITCEWKSLRPFRISRKVCSLKVL